MVKKKKNTKKVWGMQRFKMCILKKVECREKPRGCHRRQHREEIWWKTQRSRKAEWKCHRWKACCHQMWSGRVSATLPHGPFHDKGAGTKASQPSMETWARKALLKSCKDIARIHHIQPGPETQNCPIQRVLPTPCRSAHQDICETHPHFPDSKSLPRSSVNLFTCHAHVCAWKSREHAASPPETHVCHYHLRVFQQEHRVWDFCALGQLTHTRT